MSKNWSEYQTAIFSTVVRSSKDLVVLARAGTGKTTTMVEAVIRLCQSQPKVRVLACAFNVKNARELDSRLRDSGLSWKQASAKTLNSVGLATLKKAWGKGVQVDAQKGRRIAKTLVGEYNFGRLDQVSVGQVAKLATMAKVTLTNPDDAQAMSALCHSYSISFDEKEVEILVYLARQAMKLSAKDKMVVDFDDQLWFPHLFNLQPWKHDVVIVDEAQDMNASQLELARKSVKKGGRLVAVGDDRQAIYGWRGADSNFLGRMVQELGATTLPLPRTYRCGQAIVREAQKLVPDYQAAPTNPEGIVRELKPTESLLDQVGPGDFVLSRVNAPLLGLCLQLLKAKVPAVIQGRDIMGQLIGLIKKSKCETVKCLLEWLAQYESVEREKLVQADAADEQFELLADRCECLRVLSTECKTCNELISYLGDMFTDHDENTKVTLSSAHRSKGLERDRVFLLRDTFRSGGQEDNCLYVAITRARNELVYVPETSL
jgi:DNA helicase-2/ATP-dependent DNA helicase PcrA